MSRRQRVKEQGTIVTEVDVIVIQKSLFSLPNFSFSAFSSDKKRRGYLQNLKQNESLNIRKSSPILPSTNQAVDPLLRTKNSPFLTSLESENSKLVDSVFGGVETKPKGNNINNINNTIDHNVSNSGSELDFKLSAESVSSTQDQSTTKPETNGSSCHTDPEIKPLDERKPLDNDAPLQAAETNTKAEEEEENKLESIFQASFETIRKQALLRAIFRKIYKITTDPFQALIFLVVFSFFIGYCSFSFFWIILVLILVQCVDKIRHDQYLKENLKDVKEDETPQSNVLFICFSNLFFYP